MDNLKMQKAKRLLRPAVIAFVCFVVLLYGGRIILTVLALRLRQWALITELVIITLLTLALVVAVIYTLCVVFKQPQEDKWKRLRRKVLSVAGIVGVVALAVWGAIVIFLISVFSYNPEYVVEKHGQTMVASVNIWFETGVTYYEYKNFLVYGGKAVGSESYLSGNPFESASNPEPASFWFTDFDGNLIAGVKQY